MLRVDGERRLDDLQLLFSAFNAAEEWGFILESATFEDMQSTGGLALIRDVQLRLDLADYYRQGASRDDVWRLPRAYRERVRGIIPNALQAAIHERCEDDDRASRIGGLSGDVPGSYWSANVLPTVEPLTASAAAQSVCGLDAGEFRTADAAAAVRADTVSADRVVGKPYLEIDLDRAAIARYGLSVADVQQVIAVAIGGETVTTTVEGRERYPIRIRYPRERRDRAESLARILVPTRELAAAVQRIEARLHTAGAGEEAAS